MLKGIMRNITPINGIFPFLIHTAPHLHLIPSAEVVDVAALCPRAAIFTQERIDQFFRCIFKRLQLPFHAVIDAHQYAVALFEFSFHCLFDLVAFDVDEVFVAASELLPVRFVPLFLEPCLPLVERLWSWVG